MKFLYFIVIIRTVFGSPVIKLDPDIVWPALEQCAMCLCLGLCASISFQGQVFFFYFFYFLHSEEAENRIPSNLLCNDASNVKLAS